MQQFKRDQVLDYMRGFAMLMVILLHAMQRSLYAEVDYTDTVVWKLVCDWHMPLFFIVSGYLAARSKKVAGFTFIKNKFFRLLYVWFVWRWLEWIFMRFKFSGLLPFNSYVPNSFWGNFKLLFTSPFMPLWFLMDLFLFFVILWLTKIISRNNDVIWYLLLSGALIGLVVGSRFLGSVIPDAEYYFGFFATFVFGFFVGKIITHPKFSDKKWIVFFVLVTITSYICHFFSVVSVPGSHQLVSGCNAIRCTAVVLLGSYVLDKIKGLTALKNALAFMGRYSLEYYVLQFLVLNCGYWISNIYLRWAFNFVSCILLCTLIIIAVKHWLPAADGILWGNFKFLKMRSPAYSRKS